MDNNDQDDDLAVFLERVTKVMPQLIHAMLQRERNVLSAGLVTLPQFVVLNHLNRSGACRMHDISAQLKLKPSHVTAVMDRLVALGMAKRFDSKRDRRVVLAALTPKGKRAVKKIHEEKLAGMKRVYECLTSDEREVYARAMERLLQSIKEEDNAMNSQEPEV